MFHNILVSVDASPRANRALAEAIDIAVADHARLTILTAVPRSPLWMCASLSVPPPPPLDRELEKESAEILRNAVAQVPDCVPVTTILTRKRIREALQERIATGHHDLLVIGSRGRGAFASALFGSVSHHALNHSPIPVMIVHDETPRRTRFADGAKSPQADQLAAGRAEPASASDARASLGVSKRPWPASGPDPVP
ncbi:MAG: universal stress protein [Solirubrobacterales bacterium]|nr:universal stress protein [Solirubrobacterales bacterium]